MEKISKGKKVDILNTSNNFYELNFWSNQAYVCGIDEVGRGCLAGPVVTSAVILHPFVNHPLLKDSKMLTEKNRNKIVSWILENSWHAYGIIPAHEIDTINIYEATKKAMLQAFYGVVSHCNGPWKIGLTVIDAVPLEPSYYEQDMKILSFPYGESKSISIAAASILAKVKRDELISRMDSIFPGYTFQNHKGYGTQEHQKALQDLGISLIHRTTFIKGPTYERGRDEQTTFFCRSN